MSRPLTPALTESEIEIAIEHTIREAAWRISELRGAKNDPKKRISRAWLYKHLSTNGLVHKRKRAFMRTRIKALSTNGTVAVASGPRMANAPTPEVLGENGTPLSQASTGPEIQVGAIQEDASPSKPGAKA